MIGQHGTRWLAAAVVGLTLVVVPPAVPDILVTTGGSRYEGTVTEEGDSYVLTLPKGGKMKFPKSVVREIIKQDLPEPEQTATQTPAAPKDAGPGAGRIAFARARFGRNWEVHSMRAEGSDAQQLTHTAGSIDDTAPAWSPDGNKIAFVRTQFLGGHIFVMDADGSDPRDLTKDSNLRFNNPAWSPDGKKIVMEGGFSTGIFVVNSNGTGLRNIAKDPDKAYLDPTWSPDGSKIACTAGLFDSHIVVMNANGSDIRELCRGSQPAWSPDGTRIAFRHARGRIFTMNPDGTERKDLRLQTSSWPTWSGDGQRIAFMTEGAVPEVYTVNADGGDLRKIGTGAQPHWCTAGAQPSKARGKLAAASETAPPVTEPAAPAGPWEPGKDEVRLYLIRKDGLYGYIDKSGTVVVEPQFAEAREFRSGMACVLVGTIETGRHGRQKRQGSYGFLNSKGEMAVEPKYSRCDDFSEGIAKVGIFEGSRQLEWAFVNTAGTHLSIPARDAVGRFSEGLAPVRLRPPSTGGRAGRRLPIGFGYIDRSGRRAITLNDPLIRTVGDFSESMARFERYRPPAQIAQIQNELHMSPKETEKLELTWPLWGYVDKRGRVVVEPGFAQAGDFHEGLAAVRMPNEYDRTRGVLIEGKWGFIDKRGKMVIEPRFEVVTDFSEELACVRAKRIEGNVTYPDEWFFLDKAGKIGLRPGRGECGGFSEGLARCKDNVDRLWGYIDHSAHLAIKCQFEEAADFVGGLARVTLQGKWAYIDRDGQFVWVEDPGPFGIKSSPNP